ncbi:MAG TPA: tetratricopeptide repeat protein [Stenomitos sp.]
MRVDPRFNVEVTHVNHVPVQAPPAPPGPPPEAQPRMHADVSSVTRGVRTTQTWSKTRLTRTLDPSLDPDKLKLSENWRKAHRQPLVDPDARLVQETGEHLDTLLKELEERGLAQHPQYQQLNKLRDSLKRIAEREARREKPKPDPEEHHLGEAAEDLWDKLMELMLGPKANKNKAQERYEQGVQLAKQGRRKEAVRSFKRALEANPNHTDAHAKLGRLLLDAERYPEAEQHLQHAASQRPRDYQLQLGLGELYYHLGESELSRQSFTQASQLAGNHSDPHAWLGVLAYEESRLGEAAMSLEKAVQMDPSNAVARFYLAQVAFQLNDPLRGNFQLQMVKRLNPTADLSRFQKGTSALASGSTETERMQGHRWQSP